MLQRSPCFAQIALLSACAGLCTPATAADINTPAVAASPTGNLIMSVSLDSLKGKFGQRTETQVKSITTSFIWVGKGYRAGVYLPYLEITGPGVVVAGTVARGTGNTVNSTSGVGDALASLSVDLAGTPGQVGFGASATALLKLPTGDEKSGLGTGKTDYGLQTELGYRPAKSLGFQATVGRQFYGDSNLVKLQDGNYVVLGVNFSISDALSVAVNASRRDALTATTTERRDRSIQVVYALGAKSAVQLGYTQGSSPASPDSVVSVGLLLQF